MTRIILIILFLNFLPAGRIFSSGINDSCSNNDSTKTIIYSWILSENYDIQHTAVDTLLTSFQIYNPVYKSQYFGANSYLGNIGLPGISNLYFQTASRPVGIFAGGQYNANPYPFTAQSDFIFLSPYQSYLLLPANTKYYNTRRPYTNLSYFWGGSNITKEQTLKIIHTQNVNKNLNFGFRYNLISSLGQYQKQTTRNNSFLFFTSYINKRYSVHSNFSLNKFKIYENGGIIDDSYLEDSLNYSSDQIPVKLQNARTTINNKNFFLTQKYNFGKATTVLNPDSTETKIFNHKSSLTHTFKFERDYKLYTDDIPIFIDIYSDTVKFYENNFISDSITYDSIYFQSINNTIQWKINENLSRKVFKFGGRLLISNELKKYYYINFANNNLSLNNTFVSAGIFNNAGKNCTWDVSGKYYIDGYRKENFTINTKISKIIRNKNDSSIISFSGMFRNQTPDYFEENYFSNHFKWNNTFADKQETILKLSYTKPSWNLNYGINVAILNNFIYFDTTALPSQTTNEFFVYSAFINKNFNLGKWHSVHKIVYQSAQNKDVLRLPEFVLYNSVYFQQSFFKNILHTQFGFDVFYNTEYYAYSYMPATGVFYLQNEKLIGNYPYIDIFINLKLKRARFFIKCEHINSGLIQGIPKKYYNVLHYPMNGRCFRFGISWNFYT